VVTAVSDFRFTIWMRYFITQVLDFIDLVISIQINVLPVIYIRVYAELAAAVRHRWVCELTNPQMVRKMLV